MSRILKLFLDSLCRGLFEALRRFRVRKQRDEAIVNTIDKNIAENNLDTSQKARTIERDVSGASDDAIDEWMRGKRSGK